MLHGGGHTLDRIDYDKLFDVFGEPAKADKYLVKKRFPFPMFASWDYDLKISSFYGNAYIADDVIKALEEVYDYYGYDNIKKFKLNIYGGCYALRKSRGANRWSTHAWGMSIDYLPQLGGYGTPPMTPHKVVEIFKGHGFDWGGEWAYKDGMHFSAVNE